MAKDTLYGIKYPFSNESWRESYFDLNESLREYIESELLHILLTPKGQRLRRPEFGTDLIKYIFEPTDGETWTNMKNDITKQVRACLPRVNFKDVNVYRNNDDDNSTYLVVHYSMQNGNNESETYTIQAPII